ncbi:DNA-(apurinic or apyrimidinic site) endonuclease [Uranotaenia lowii]|uniref:DNA-(apurinic or apyrimidinic site) endonuclease n=1 Tax=Uranotaenia lowii TaxID=190385 RepID=UPI002478BDFF|nr:DNA-(apurinic or apyrimidinic site) endonuclease [Uranotaenia lowii]
MASKRGRPGKKAVVEEVVAPEVDNVEPVKNGIETKKKAVSAKSKSGAPVASEVPSKGGRGRKAAKEEPEVEPVIEEPAVVAKKGGRGRKPANGAAIEAPEVEIAAPPAKQASPAKKGKVVVESNSSPVAAKGKGRGKTAAPVAATEEPAAEPAPPAAKRGRKGKAETKEPEQAPSPAKKAKQIAGPENNEEAAPAPAKGRGRGKKPASEKAASPEKASPKAPAKKGGRGKKVAAAESEVQLDTPEDQKTTSTKTYGKSKKNEKKEEVIQVLNGDTPKEDKSTITKATEKTNKIEKNDETVAPLNGVTQRKKKKTADDVDGNAQSAEEPKAKKAKADKKPAAPKMNKTGTDYSKLNFDLDGKEFNYKISSWNVAGLRSWIDKGGLEFFEHEKPDILCVQETKCAEDQLPDAARQIKGYHPYWLCKPGGYAGVAIYSKKMPLNVTYGLGDEEQDADGRVLTAEYLKFYLVCVYVPNAGRGLVTLPKRMRWDEKFQAYLKELDSKKPVILCGDMNVAHEEIDLANPKTNKKNAGFTPEERAGMSKLLSLGFVDTFRQIYPDQKSAYTFWTYMGNARAKNVGWRLDYFIASERLQSKVVDHVIRTEVYGSDHCPITLFLNL